MARPSRWGGSIALPMAHAARNPWLTATTAAGVLTGLAEVTALRRLERALVRRPPSGTGPAGGHSARPSSPVGVAATSTPRMS